MAVETKDWKLPLEVRMNPKYPHGVLVLWKGEPLAALGGVRLESNPEKHEIVIRKSAYFHANEAVWKEMEEAGVKVEEAEFD